MVDISVGILIAQIAIAVGTLITYFKVHRHRAIYSIKTAVLRMPRGTPTDIYALKTEHIDKELADGKYTILQVVERVDKDLEIILGQIKK